MTDESKQAREAFVEYTKAFGRLDPAAVAHHFHIPSVMAVPGKMFAFNDQADVERTYAQLMADLPGRGYARSELPNLKVQRLSDDMAVVTSVCIWRKADGTELQRNGITYTLRKVNGTWKNLSALIHDASTYA